MSRLRAEDGMTLIELLVALSIGFIVVAATLGLLESSLRLNSGVVAKTDATQRGRLAMDTITQQLRSQVCLNLDTPAIVGGSVSNENSVTYYADFSDAKGDVAPVKRKLTFDPSSGAIQSYTYKSTTVPATKTSYPAMATRSNLVLENAALQWNAQQGTSVPFLRYYAYKLVDGTPVPEDPLAPPLSDAEVARVARIEIAYFAKPTRTADTSKGVNMSDQITVRHADPNHKIQDPTCV